MNSSWQIYCEPPSFWTGLCLQANSIFHTPAWQAMLKRAFSVQPLYLYQPEAEIAWAVTVFKAGPFRVGYVGFPAGQALNGALTDTMAQSLQQATWPYRLDLLRLNSSLFVESMNLVVPYKAALETVLPLENWSRNDLPARVRRDVRQAEKSGVLVKEATKDADVFFTNLYQKTVRRHGGSIRYTRTYFRELLKMTATRSQLRAWIAILADKPIAFLVAVHDGKTVFYLHGAFDWEYRRHQASDLLFYNAINWAKERGATQFNMMSSPVSQPSLVEYKEKWGGVTSELRTYDWSFNPITRHLLRYAMRGYDMVSCWLIR